MIESSFLSSSSELFQDFVNSPDILSFDSEDLSYENNESFNLFDSNPVDISFSSSDYENMLLDDSYDLGGDKVLPVFDTFVSQIIEDHTHETGFSDLDWLTISDSPKKQYQTVNVTTNCDGKSQIFKCVEYLLATKLWSRMTQANQLKTLHALSDTVSVMNAKEQKDIINIIDPTAVISSEVNEFVLDNTLLSDAKLKKIKDYIKKWKFQLKDSSPSSFSQLVTAEKTNSPSKLISRNSRTKRKQKKQKVLEVKQEKRRRQKQTKKQLNSEFFVYETKLKLYKALEEDEDVNILE